MDLQLTNKTAVVTGATAGIGLAIARTLAGEGAKVVVVGRSEGKLSDAAAEIGLPVVTVACDVSTAQGVSDVAKAVPEVDILVNNLGIYEATQFGDITDEDWRNMLEVNVMSGVRLSRHYLPGMLMRNWGRVIFMSSDSALVPPPDMIHYGASKTAQLAISRGLAVTTRGSAVTVNSVLPGTTRSVGVEEFVRRANRGLGQSQQEQERAFFAEHRPSSLIQRMIEPEEVAALVTFLASPLSSAINGAAIRSDGGIVPTLA